MKKLLFVSDLDNTLLFSRKISQPGDICIEKNDEIEQGFMTEFTYHSLEVINRTTTFIPVTSRSIEQYRRIQWNDNQLPQYAIVTNGGILLKDGKIDLEWLRESQELVKPYEKEMHHLCDIFRNTENCKVNRIVDGMYFYVHCYDELQAADCVNRYKATSQLKVISHGRKVYFFPPAINKGIAVERLKAYVSCESMMAAGDSIIDVPMLQKADYIIIPGDLKNVKWKIINGVNVCDEKNFSDYVCKQILKICIESV